MKTKNTLIGLTTLVVVVVILTILFWPHAQPEIAQAPTQGQVQPSATATYACDGKKAIAAAFFNGSSTPPSAPGQPPTPGGSVVLALSDGRTMTLKQTISADGGRYASVDGTFVFWNTGDKAFITENNSSTYANCVQIVSGGATTTTSTAK